MTKCPGFKRDAIFRAVVDNIIPFAIGEAVPVLHRNDGNDLTSALDVLARDVRQTDMANFALLAKLRQCFDRCLE